MRDAVPLSRFLLDAAAEDCDLQTAEGRSRFAARALATVAALLPAGALAAQLLGDIAAQVQIGTHELEQLGGLRRMPRGRYENDSNSRASHKAREPKTPG